MPTDITTIAAKLTRGQISSALDAMRSPKKRVAHEEMDKSIDLAIKAAHLVIRERAIRRQPAIEVNGFVP